MPEIVQPATDRRNFLTDCISGAAWLMGWKGEPKPEQTVCKRDVAKWFNVPPEKMGYEADKYGGYIVPAEVAGVLPLVHYVTLNHSIPIRGPSTIEQCCKARGIEYKPETEEEKSKRMHLIAALNTRSKPCES